MRTPDQVSVIIPTYNRAPLLRQALASVLAQSVRVGEVVVVDDGSTDETAAVVREFASKRPATYYLPVQHTNDLGLLRHAGIERSRGRVIALLDSDDVWLPTRVERQLASWNERPSAGFAFCNIRQFNDSGPFPGGPWLDPRRDYSGRMVRDLLLEPVALPSALMFDRDVYFRVGPYSGRPVNEDYEWLLEAAALYSAAYLPDPMVMMRAHEGSRSRDKSLQAHTEYLSIVRRFVASHPELTRAERRAARIGMANVHLKLARHMLGSRNHRQAAREVVRAILLHPADRRAYGLLMATLVAWRGDKPRSSYPQ
jgi:glycosyltransferase involved in cell wall biosynthesis